MHSKASLSGVIRDHRSSYTHAATGQRLPADHLLFEGLPVATAALALGFGADMGPALTGALVALVALLSFMSFIAFIFTGGLVLRLPAQLAMVDATPAESSRRRQFLEEVLANTAYATVAGVACLVVLAAGLGPGELWRADGLALGLVVHVLLIGAMVMKRLMALGQVAARDTLLVDHEAARAA